jgi:hypothetical protein
MIYNNIALILCRFEGAKLQKKSFSHGGFFKKTTIIPTRQGRHSAVRASIQCIMTKKRVIGIGETVLGNNISDDLVAVFREKKGTKKGTII